MYTFKNKFISEKSEKQVIYVDGELWLTYGQGSGMTALFKDLNSYITNKSGDKNYDSLVDKIVDWSKTAKSLKSKGNTKVFEINEYPHVSMGKSYDIWGGDVKPLKKLYLMVDDNGKIGVVSLFKSKKEAMNWINSLVNESEFIYSDSEEILKRDGFWDEFQKLKKGLKSTHTIVITVDDRDKIESVERMPKKDYEMLAREDDNFENTVIRIYE